VTGIQEAIGPISAILILARFHAILAAAKADTLHTARWWWWRDDERVEGVEVPEIKIGVDRGRTQESPHNDWN
jgi:hypothetical protein